MRSLASLGKTGGGQEDLESAMAFVAEWIEAFWGVLLASGWWLVVGFALAGLIHALVPMDMVSRHLGGRGIRPIIKASVAGLPLPLCSCSVIPAAASLRAKGASRGASASFAISTPETGEESIAITWGLLGPVMALIRPIGAIATALAAGLAIDAIDPDRKPAGTKHEEPAPETPLPVATCCASSAPPNAEPRACCSTPDPVNDAPSCCSTPASAPDAHSCCPTEPKAEAGTAGAKIRSALRYGLVTLPADLAPWLVGGLALSALIGVLVDETWMAEHLSTGLAPMIIMLVIGLPLYVCATSSTPVAAMLVAKGLSPGAAIVFLLAGPATNMATMAWVYKDLGRRSLVMYIVVIALMALVIGVLVDQLVAAPTIRDAAAHALHHEGAGVIKLSGGIAVALLLGVGVVRRIMGATRTPRARYSSQA